MTYQDAAQLARDPMFGMRLGAALAKEAVGKPSDYLVDIILKNPDVGAAYFMPFVASAPGFDETYGQGGQGLITDGELLSAIQASWQRVYDLYEEPETP